MKLPLLLLMLPIICVSQTYTSPYTQHLPSGIIEDINRTITFSESEVQIITETPEGKDLYVLRIQQVTSEFLKGSAGEDTIFLCVTRDGKFPTTIRIPYQEKIEIIDVIEPSLDGEGEHYYRFLVD
ncbi:hypothetical protein JRG66_05570 [Salinimicrobium tongyeongense]|uniref:Uncharacterized protein n=1 Tax=Salinimicrobium tongyeongense TaxID=2809707 RepID=A0ABY6NU38_9FLAO|nr:hypothetical protein [Salinimicrobium tongyeongense]UZH56333.1 hypothetical protein JRG66_05570 [Salinimicrobium tongyeongense]